MLEKYGSCALGLSGTPEIFLAYIQRDINCDSAIKHHCDACSEEPVILC
jgi:hypothetical protein